MLFAALGRAAAQAPDEIRLEAGAAEVRQAGSRSRDAALMGVVWRRSRNLVATTASGSMTVGRDSIDTAQGVIAVRYQLEKYRRWSIETGLAGALFSVTRFTGSGNAAAFVRTHREYGTHGYWVGGAGGLTNRTGEGLRSTSYDAGVWGRLERTSATLSAVTTRSLDTDLLSASSIPSRRPVGTYTVRDVTLGVQQSMAALDLAAIGTLRRGEGVVAGVNDRALMLAASLYVSPMVALTVSAGRQLADPLRALPDARFVSVSVRVLLLREDPAVRRISRYGAIAMMKADPAGGAMMTLRVLANSSARVEAYGGFSDWQPVQMHWVLDAWELRVHLPPGPQRVAVRINGSEWRAPANLTKVTDEFGGEAGLVVVP